jgi:hypothetical protein
MKYIACCPDCERCIELSGMPGPGRGWPHCEACGQSMNVYAGRNKRKRAKEDSKP